MRSISAGTPTSPAIAATRPLAPAPIALTAASSASRPRAAIRTSAPEAANLVAIARPRPLLPPVTIADRLVRSMSMGLLARRLAQRLLVGLRAEAHDKLAAHVEDRPLDHRRLIEHQRDRLPLGDPVLVLV